LPVTAEQPVQLLFTQRYAGPNTGLPVQSASAQQLPAVHKPPQQKSLVLAAQGPLVLHADVTH
jgi:hypothetical protein